MKTLDISPELALPLDAATQKIAYIGRTGSGKSYLAGVTVEAMLDAGIQVVIFDPVGIWYGLRMKADGSPGYPLPVFGGLKGDIPLEPTAGALIADLVVDRGISCVIDVSQFESDADKARFAAAFADRFYFRKKANPSAVHLVVDEAQEFIPQNPKHGEERMLHAFVRICKLGRNFGIGVSLISQRPQEVSKKALNQTELLFAFQMTGPQERKAIELWMSEKGIDTDVAGALPGLKVGTCFAWSPQWLSFSGLIHGRAKKTINSSSTPAAGAKVQKRDLAPIDLEQLSAKMKETIERAKADDPKILKAELARLRVELAKKPTLKIEKMLTPPKPPRVVEKPVISKADLATIYRGIDSFSRALKKIEERVDKYAAPMLEVRAPLVPGPKMETIASYAIPRKDPPGKYDRTIPDTLTFIKGTEITRPPLGTSTGNDRQLTVSQRKILGILLMLEIRGIPASRECVAAWLDIHHRGGSYGENLAFLRQEGYLEPESLIVTELGRTSAMIPETGFGAALGVLTGSQAKILELLRDGTTFSRDVLGESLGIHPRGGSFGENLARLRTMGLISPGGLISILPTAER